MQPLPIPTQGKPWSHCLSPTILPSYILVDTNHPSFSTILFTSIRHFYLPTCTRAPSYISIHSPTFNTYGGGGAPFPSLGKHCSHSPSPSLGEAVHPLPIPNLRQTVHPLPIPTLGQPVQPLPIPYLSGGPLTLTGPKLNNGQLTPHGPIWGC